VTLRPETSLGSLGDGTECHWPEGIVLHLSSEALLAAADQNDRPRYPPIARAARVHGDVKLEVAIDVPSGKVRCLRVTRPLPLLDRAIVETVKRWTFRTEGWPTGADVAVGRMAFNFRIKGVPSVHTSSR
jgi:TonB family protein